MADTIKASELIGRIFLSVKFQIPVTCTPEDIAELVRIADGASIEHYIHEMFEPVPLMLEWFEKFGAKETGDYNEYRRFEFPSGFYVACSRLHPNDLEIGGKDIMVNKTVLHVHGFQNLCFELFDIELKIKPKEKRNYFKEYQVYYNLYLEAVQEDPSLDYYDFPTWTEIEKRKENG